MSKSESLWEKAFASLNDEDKPPADPHTLDKRTFLDDIAKVVEEKRLRCAKKEWKLSRNGKIVSTRDILGRVVSWINKFKAVGDIAVQYDPAHAALPWAAVRFLLQTIVNEHQTHEALVEGLEHISGLIARFALVEGLYLNQQTVASQQLSDAIIRLYSAVLIYLAKAGKFYSHNAGGRFAKTVVQPVELSVGSFRQNVEIEEKRVNNLARLHDADYLRRITEFMKERFSSHDIKLDAIGHGIQDLQLSLDMTTQSVSTEAVLEWIAAVFTKEDYERALAARVEGTCDWILKHPEFLTWVKSTDKDVTSRILWIYGAAGFGKTILCARLIHYLQTELKKTVAFFFCSFTDDLRRQPSSILRSWIAQLIMQREVACEAAKQAYLERRSSKATDQDLWHLFKRFSKQVKDSVFVVDGYDECIAEKPNLKSHAISNSQVVFLESLISSTEDSGSYVLIVSRENHDIREQLSSVASTSRAHEIFRLQITQNDTRDDVNSFSSYLMEQRLPNKTAELRKDLVTTATEKCDGMFLWVRLLQERLSPGKNARQLQKIVTDTPVGLEQAYERDLQAIHNLAQDERERAFKILWWTLYAFRPLTVSELTEALLIEPDDEQVLYPFEDLPDAYDEDYINDQIRRLCGSLIDVRHREGYPAVINYTVQFVHFSVKEYLFKALQEHFPTMRTRGSPVSEDAKNDDLLAQHCLRYLCYDDFVQTSLSTKDEFDQKVQKYSFLRYTSQEWVTHASHGEPPSSDLVVLSNRLHDPSANRWRSYSEVLLSESFEDFSDCLTEYSDSWPDPLFLASRSGLAENVEYVISSGAKLDLQVGRKQQTALYRAVSRINHPIAMLLLDRGADVNIGNASRWTCLQVAAVGNQISLTQALIDKGAKVNARDDIGCTALLAAAQYGHIEIVDILMDHGGDLNIATESGWTCLHAAARFGRTKVVEILLRRGADPAQMTSMRRAAIHLAVDQGCREVVKVFLDHGVGRDIRNSSGRNSLHLSCAAGNEELTALLLECGCDVNSVDYLGCTALMLWATQGSPTSTSIIEVLLGRANINQEDFGGQTALHHVILSAFERLRDDSLYKEPICYPSATSGPLSTSHQVTIQTLLRHGADPLQRDHYGWSSTDWAAWHPTLLALLVQPDTIYNQPEEAEVARIRNQSLKSVVKHLVYLKNLEPQPDIRILSRYYNHVGRLLLARKHREDARIAFMASAEIDIDSDKLNHRVVCDMCEARVLGDRHACETCPDIDLCGDCLALYKLDPQSQSTRVGLTISNCKGHDFFHISEDEWHSLRGGLVNQQGETETAFVERLRRTYT